MDWTKLWFITASWVASSLVYIFIIYLYNTSISLSRWRMVGGLGLEDRGNRQPRWEWDSPAITIFMFKCCGGIIEWVLRPIGMKYFGTLGGAEGWIGLRRRRRRLNTEHPHRETLHWSPTDFGAGASKCNYWFSFDLNDNEAGAIRGGRRSRRRWLRRK